MIDDDRLQAESLELERMLEELQQLVPAPAWQRVERVLGRVIRLYGAGLAHAIEYARAAGVNPAMFDELLAGDDLLASLLLLHGLHPIPLADRIQRALAMARSELGLADDDLVLVAIADDAVQLHAARPLGSGAMAERVAEAAIRRLLEAVAPEVRVEIASAVPVRDPRLVQIRRREAR